MKYQFFSLLTIFFNFISALFIGLTPIQIQANELDETEFIELEIKTLLKINIDKAITPVTLEYIKHQTKIHPHDAILIQMNTPGGLLSATKDIITYLSSLNVPIITWIGPSGASATSAGAIICSGGHYIYMSEGTNIGAATPISMFGSFDKSKQENQEVKDQDDLRSKIINDTVSYIRSLSEKNLHNPLPFEEMVTKAKSFTAKEALEKNIIDGIANSEKQLLEIITAKKITLNNHTYKLKISSDLITTQAKLDLGQSILSFLTDPNLVFILIVVGLLLIYVELQAPGGYIAGIAGAICLIISAIGLQILSINFASLLLILFSAVLFFLEIYITSFGILFLLGLTSLTLGSMFLFRTDDSLISVSISVIASVILAALALGGGIVYIILKSKKKIGQEKFNDLTNLHGFVVSTTEQEDIFSVKVGAEIWQAHCDEELKVGDKISVLCKNSDLTLQIKKLKNE